MYCAGDTGILVASPPLKRVRSDPYPHHAASTDAITGASRGIDYASGQACLPSEVVYTVNNDALMPIVSPFKSAEQQWMEEFFGTVRPMTAGAPLGPSHGGSAAALHCSYSTPQGGCLSYGYEAAPDACHGAASKDTAAPVLPGWPLDSSSPNRSGGSAQTWDAPAAQGSPSAPQRLLLPQASASTLASRVSVSEDLLDPALVLQEELMMSPPRPDGGLPPAAMMSQGLGAGRDVASAWDQLRSHGGSIMFSARSGTANANAASVQQEQLKPRAQTSDGQQQQPTQQQAGAQPSRAGMTGAAPEQSWALPGLPHITTTTNNNNSRATFQGTGQANFATVAAAAAAMLNGDEGSTNESQLGGAVMGLGPAEVASLQTWKGKEGPGAESAGAGAAAGQDNSGEASRAEVAPSAAAEALAALRGEVEASGGSDALALWRWLLPLTTNTSFFKPCPVCCASASDRSSLASFFDCNDPDHPMCGQCATKQERAGHKVLQVRRSTYHEVLKASDSSGLLDVKGIQQYVINGHKVYFLRPRPQPRAPKGAVLPAKCVVDGRQLMEAGHAYCSIRCKYVYEHPEFAALVARVAPAETYSPRPCSKAGPPCSPSSSAPSSSAANFSTAGSGAPAAAAGPAVLAAGAELAVGSPRAEAALVEVASPWGGVGGPQQLLPPALSDLVPGVGLAEPPELADLLADRMATGESPGLPHTKMSRTRSWLDM